MSRDPLVGKVLADRFEILDRIGEGGTGVVYKAKQLSVDRLVAIKLLGAHVSTDPQWVKRFHNEARAASKLTHPNTVQLIDFGQTKEGMLFIAMEFLQGTPLSGEIEKKGKLPANRALNIVGQICASLAEAHQQGIIHRDIKPDNVFLIDRPGGGDHVKVLDFSVAKMDTPDAQVTRAGMVFGTPSYMSPEQGRGAKLDARSDVYAVGIVLYEMLTGKPPFDSRIPTEVVMMHLQKDPPPMAGVPPKVAAITMKALAKDPAHRQQSASDFEQEATACLNELFGRQTPGAGVPLGVPAAVPQQAPAQEMKTMIGAAAPNFAVPAATPQRPPNSEMKTMMADAPVLPPPPAAGSGGSSEQRTMMASAPSNLPPVASGPSNQATRASASAPPPQVGSEMKTMIAGQAPVIAPPPGYGTQPPPTGGATAEQRTVMGEAPVLPQPKTQMAVPAQQPKGAGTVVLAEAPSNTAVPAPRAKPVAAPSSGAGALFWMTWLVLGIGLGMATHFVLVPRFFPQFMGH